MKNICLRNVEEDYINLSPIQAGGRLTKEARKALISYGDGYSVCDYCMKGRLDKIKKPPISGFYERLAEFVNMNTVRVVRGARDGFRIVTNSLLNEGDKILVSEYAHYSLCLSIEIAGGEWIKVPGNNNHIITAENVEKEIKKNNPSLVAISHIDYIYGNMHEAEKIGKICKKHSIPFLYNGAYTVGIMPVDGEKIGADFIVGSGHKSMSACAPTGVLGVNKKYEDKVLRTSESFKNKESELLGCTVMGAPLISLMASFPKVKKRIKNWKKELDKTNYFIKELLRIDGTRVVSNMPRKHTLTRLDTRNSFDKIARKHKKKGYFLISELRDKGITGIIPGRTKSFKINSYGLTEKELDYAAEVFISIAEKNGLRVE